MMKTGLGSKAVWQKQWKVGFLMMDPTVEVFLSTLDRSLDVSLRHIVEEVVVVGCDIGNTGRTLESLVRDQGWS